MQDENFTETEGMHTDTMDVEEYSIEESEDMEEINFDTVVDTKINNIKNMFTAAELKTTDMSRHYIVRDSIDEFYYLKVNIYDDHAEYQYCLKYFQDLMTFTQQLAQTKKDVLRILNVQKHEEEGHFEIIVISDYGESDCIDIEKIEELHIIRFLKNLCILLKDAKNIYKLYHSNLTIDNIILVENELKISGFKPRFLDTDKVFKSWKYDIARKYGFFRLDLFMIGLLWLKLLNKEIDPLTGNSLSLDEMYPKVQEFKKTIQHVNNSQLIEMLLDLEANPKLLLDNVILEFDQWIIIVIKKQEELVSSGVSDPRYQGNTNDGVDRGTGAFAEMNQRTEEEVVEEGEGNGQQSEIIKKNLSNNLTRSKVDANTETENDTPNVSKSIIKVHNGNISLAGDESSILGGRLNETIESDINTSRNEGGESGLRTKGITFGGAKKEVHSNKILGEEFKNEMNNEYGRVSEMRTRKSKRGVDEVENDFEPNRMVDARNQDLEDMHREVIYDQSEEVKQRTGTSKVIRYSGKEGEQGGKGQGEGKSNSLTVKIETRLNTKNGGGQFENENFESSEKPRSNLTVDHGELMESGFRRETFGPGEDRLNHGTSKTKKTTEKKIFINNLINEGIGSKEGKEEHESPLIKKTAKSKGERHRDSEGMESQMTSKFSEVRQSLERDGLKQVKELDEEKSNEDNEGRNGGESNVKEVNIQIMGYERSDSEEEVKPKNGKDKLKKTGSKGKEKKKTDKKKTDKKTGKAAKTGKRASRVIKKRESMIKGKPTKKGGSTKTGKTGKKNPKKTDKKTTKESKTKVTNEGKETTTVTTTTVTTTNNGKTGGDVGGKRNLESSTKIEGGNVEITIPNQGDNGEGEQLSEHMNMKRGSQNNVLGGGNQETFPLEETVNSEGNKVTIERIREGDKEIIITRTTVERIIMENGAIKKIKEIIEEREERTLVKKRVKGENEGNGENEMNMQMNVDEGSAGDVGSGGNKGETVTVHDMVNQEISNTMGGNTNEDNGGRVITEETRITRENIKGKEGEPETIINEVVITENVSKKIKAGRRKSPPKVQKLLDQKSKKLGKKDPKKDSKRDSKKDSKKSSKKPKKEKEPSEKKLQPSKKKSVEVANDTITKPLITNTQGKSKNSETVTSKFTPLVQKGYRNNLRGHTMDSDANTSREREQIELDKHKDKNIKPLNFSPKRKLIFNKDKLLQSSEENIDNTFAKKEMKKPKLYKGDTGSKMKKKRDKSPRDTSREKSEPKKSKSRPKKSKSKPKDALTSSVEKEYRWKNHNDLKSGPLGYRFENPKHKKEKIAKNKKNDPSDSKNFSMGIVAKPSKKEKGGYGRPANYNDVPSRYKLKDIKKPKMQGDKFMLTSGQLRRNRYKGSPGGGLNETDQPVRSHNRADSPFGGSRDKKPWKLGGTTPQPFNFRHEKPEGYDGGIKFRKSPKSQSVERPIDESQNNPNIYKKINRILQNDPVENTNDFGTFQQPDEEMKETAPINVHFSPDILKKDIAVDQEFFNDIEEVKKKIKAKEYPEATGLLKDMLTRYEGRPQVEIYKLIAMLMFKTKEYPEAIKYITECLDVIAKQKFPDKKRIQRGLIFNLIVVYIQLKKFPGALALIDEMKDFPLQKNKIRGNLVESQEYLELLTGDCRLGMKDHKAARPHFENYFKYLLQREISPQTVIEMLNVVNKIVVCLTEEGDPVATQNFVESVIKIFEKILVISKEKGLTEFLSKDFLETLILDLLDIFYLKSNFSMLYFLLSKASEHKCYSHGSFISDKQIIKVVHLCIKTASFLRSSPESRPRIPLTKAISLLKYGKTILKRLPETEETNKLDLLLTFNQGVYHLEKEDFFKSKTLFDKCLEKYPQLMGKSDHKFFRILYNIGLSLYNLKKFQEALHFFEKIYRQLVDKNMNNIKTRIEDQDLGKRSLNGQETDPLPKTNLRPEESDLFLRVIKILAKIYYRLGKYEDCHLVLNSYVNSVLERASLPPGFFKYLTMYYLCCQRIKTSDFHGLFDKVLKMTNDPENAHFNECQHYFNLFFNMNKVSLEKQDCPEYPDYQRFVQRMAKKEGTPEKFISTLNLMYSKFAKKDNNEALDLNMDLIKQMRQKDVSISENAQKIENFLFNFLFIIIHKLNSSKTNAKDLPKTAKILDDIRQFKEQHQIYDKIYELLSDQNYNSLYNSELNQGHIQHVQSQIFENNSSAPKPVFAKEESLDGTDFTITDAPMEVAEFNPLRTFEEKRVFRVESEYKKKDAKPKSTKARHNKKTPKKSKHDTIYDELISKARVADDDFLGRRETQEMGGYRPVSAGPRGKDKKASTTRGVSSNFPQEMKKKRYSNHSRNPRDNSVDFVKKNNLKRKKCICVDDLTFKWDIMKHIDEFFSNLKSMNFLGLGGEIDQYFQRFMMLIRDKNLHWRKFRFVKQLIDFYLQCTYKKSFMTSDATLPKNSGIDQVQTVITKTVVTTDANGNVVDTKSTDQVVDANHILSDVQSNSLDPNRLTGPESSLQNSSSTIKKPGFTVPKFQKLLESIIKDNRPCIHDYKLMTVLMESFGDDQYLDTFLQYMSDTHPELATMILRMLILDDFETKSAKLYSQLFKKIFKNRQFILKNSWMYSHLSDVVDSSQQVMDKALLNSMYIKKRYLWLADSANELIIRKHFSPQDMLVFKLRFSCFQSLVYLLKFSPNQSEFLLKTHLMHLKSLFSKLSKTSITRNISKFLHDLLVLCFFAQPETSANLEQLEICLDNMADHCDYVQKYKFSIILSQLGKCLFRKGLFQEALRLFTKAYYAFKGCSDKDKNAFPPFMPRSLPKNFFFNILCFITICNYHLSRLDPTIEILKTISDTKFDTDTAYVEMLLMHALLSRMTTKPDECLDFLQKARTYMNNSAKISSSKRKIFNVFISSQLLEVLKRSKAAVLKISSARQELKQAVAIFNQDHRIL